MSSDFNYKCKRIAAEGDVDGARDLFAGLASKQVRTKLANALVYELTQLDFFTDQALKSASVLMVMALDNGASPNHTPQDYSVFDNACTQGHLPLVKLLRENGVDVDSSPTAENQSKNGTPLMLAIGQGHEDVVEYLLDEGANLEALNIYGETAIFWAVSYGQHDLRELLYARGASVDKVDNAGNTLLHAVFNHLDDLSVSGALTAIDRLCKWGVDPNLPDITGKTAIEAASDIATVNEDPRFLHAIQAALASRTAKLLEGSTPESSRSSPRRQL